MTLEEVDYVVVSSFHSGNPRACGPHVSLIQLGNNCRNQLLRGSNDELVQYLRENYGKSFVKSHGTESVKFIKRQGLDKTFFECERRMWRMGSRQLPEGILVDGGSDWVALHRSFCQYLFHSKQNELLAGLRIFFNYTLLPAESFFHTALHNSEHCHDFVNNNLRLTNWRRKKGCNCQYKHIVDWCGCSPNVLRADDLDKVLSYVLRPIFFARKFDPMVDLEIINQVLNRTAGKTTAGDNLAGITWKRHWLNFYSAPESFSSRETASLVRSLARIGHIAASRKPILSADVDVQDAHILADLEGRRSLLVSQKLTTASKAEFLIESHFTLKDHFEISQEAPLNIVSRIKHFWISTDFDQKEEMFRNYANILGPYSEPALAYDVTEGDLAVMSVVWIDPAHTVAGSFEVNLTTPSELHKPVFKHPLRPGVWNVYMMHSWKVVAQTKFLIIPLDSGETLFKENLGPSDNEYIKYNFSSVSKLFKLDQKQKLQAANEHARKTVRLTGWIDELVHQFYTLEGSCVWRMGESVLGELVDLPSCQECDWSSFFPEEYAKLVF